MWKKSWGKRFQLVEARGFMVISNGEKKFCVEGWKGSSFFLPFFSCLVVTQILGEKRQTKRSPSADSF